MIEKVLRILRAADVKFDDRDMADVLWLARLLPQGASIPDEIVVDASLKATPHDREERPSDDKTSDDLKESESDDDSSTQQTRKEVRQISVSRESLRDGDVLYSGTPKADDNQNGIGVSRIRVPSAPGLFNALALARSLRPLAKRFPSRHNFSLDEEATAELSAEARMLMPVFKAERERRFEVALVVEDLPSMALWRRMIAEFHRLLQQQGAFRDVRRWTLSLSEGGAHLIDPTGSVRSPSELRHSEGRRLILLVSDCLSPAWYGSAIAKLFADWGASTPVAVLQLLPEHLWPQTAIGPTRARLHALVPGTPNSMLDVEREWWDDDPIAGMLPLPVLTLDEKSLGDWSRLLMGVGSRARGVLMAQPSQIVEPEAVDVSSGAAPPASADERLQRFRALVSFDAFRLAAFLAVVPLSLPVMRLVQSAMFPRPSESQMAEVFLGGIIERVTPLNAAVGDDDVEYEFAGTSDDGAVEAGAALRNALLRSIRRSEMQQVIDTVSQYVNDRVGSPVDFYAWVQNDAATDVLPANARSFAKLARSALARLGVGVSDRVPQQTFVEEEVFGEGLTIMRRVALPDTEHHQISWSPDGEQIAVRGTLHRDHYIWVIHAATGATSRLKVSDDTAITAMVWSQSSTELAFAVKSAYGGTGVFVQTLPLAGTMERDVVPPIVTENPIDDLDWRAAFDEMVVAHDTGFVEFFRRIDQRIWSRIEGAGTTVSAGRPLAALSWSRFANMFAALYVDGGVRVFRQTEQLMTLAGTVGLTIPVVPGAPLHAQGNPSLLAWHPREEWIVYLQPGGKVQVATPTLEKIAELDPGISERRVQGLSVSRDGALVALESESRITVWRTSDWTAVSAPKTETELPGVPSPVAFSPHDAVLAVSDVLGDLLLLRVDEAALSASRNDKSAQPAEPVEKAEVEDDDVFVANGLHAGRGGYLIPPLAPSVMADIAMGRPIDRETRKALTAIARREDFNPGLTRPTIGTIFPTARQPFGTIHGVDPNNLAKAGWGVAFLAGDPDADAMREALSPLLRQREEQSGRLYREFIGDAGISKDSDGWDFLSGLGLATGQPVDPEVVPYYVTIVASPESVSFDAQCAMDTQNAVGRIWFDGAELKDRLDALEKYATAMVAREKAAMASPKRALFFASRNKGDNATQRSAAFLATPVSAAFAEKHPSWKVQARIGAAALKQSLVDALNGSEPPSLLVTATHGAAFDKGDTLQYERQGALVCQDWGGLASTGPLTENEYFTAHDITTANLPGTIAFLFASYGAGTPAFDAFLPQEIVEEQQIAERPFVARLPQQLLLAGAAAVIGHVERAWTCSFQWPGIGAQAQVFMRVFDALMSGTRVGDAMEFFDAQLGSVSMQLVAATKARRARKRNELEVGALWTAQMDARNYIVLGDPAARLDTASISPRDFR